jgi:hypothetical protein
MVLPGGEWPIKLDRIDNLEMNRKKIFMICLVLWGASFALYIPSLQSDFVNYDDVTILLNHPNLFNETSFLSSLKEIVYRYFPREEPLILRDITWAIDSYLYGFRNPFGYHVSNILIHSCNVVLLFLFLLLTCNRLVYSLFIAITFSALSVHVEPVAWIMGRKDLLVTFFMLITLIIQTCYIRTGVKEKKRGLYLATILTTTAALLSKINALTFFAVLGAHQLFYPVLSGSSAPEAPLDFKRRLRDILPRVLPHLLISLFIYFWYRNLIGSWGVLEREVANFSSEHITSLLTFTPIILVLYLKIIFVPFQYSIQYQWPNIYDPLTTPQVFVSLCIAVIIIWVSIIMFLKRKDLLFYWISFFLLMIPYLNIIYIGIWIANRYVYFSAFCILCLVGELYLYFIKNKWLRSISLLIWLCFILLNVFQTYKYQAVWENEYTLWHYENGLKNASLTSFSALSYSYMQLARQEVNPASRSTLFTKAENIIRRGLERYDHLENQKWDQNVSKLYYMKALLSGYRNESLVEQLNHYKKAYEIQPEVPRVSRKLFQLYYKMAMDTDKASEKKALALLSFLFFEQHVDLTWNDPVHRWFNSLALEEIYRKNFPFLKEEIDRVKKRFQ